MLSCPLTLFMFFSSGMFFWTLNDLNQWDIHSKMDKNNCARNSCSEGKDGCWMYCCKKCLNFARISELPAMHMTRSLLCVIFCIDCWMEWQNFFRLASTTFQISQVEEEDDTGKGSNVSELKSRSMSSIHPFTMAAFGNGVFEDKFFWNSSHALIFNTLLYTAIFSSFYFIFTSIKFFKFYRNNMEWIQQGIQAIRAYNEQYLRIPRCERCRSEELDQWFQRITTFYRYIYPICYFLGWFNWTETKWIEIWNICTFFPQRQHSTYSYEPVLSESTSGTFELSSRT